MTRCGKSPVETPFEFVNTYGAGTVVEEVMVDVIEDEFRRMFRFGYLGTPIIESEGTLIEVLAFNEDEIELVELII